MTEDVEYYSKLTVSCIHAAIGCYESGMAWLDSPDYRKDWRMDSVAQWHRLSDQNLEMAVRYARTAARYALAAEPCQ